MFIGFISFTLSNSLLQCPLDSFTHLAGTAERKIFMWKSKFLPGWLMMETEGMSFNKRAGRSEAEQDLGVQMQKPCPLQLKVELLRHYNSGDIYSSIYSLSAHHICSLTHFHCYSDLWAHLPMGTGLIKQENFPTDLQFPRDELKHQVYLILIIILFHQHFWFPVNI